MCSVHFAPIFCYCAFYNRIIRQKKTLRVQRECMWEARVLLLPEEWLELPSHWVSLPLCSVGLLYLCQQCPPPPTKPHPMYWWFELSIQTTATSWGWLRLPTSWAVIQPILFCQLILIPLSQQKLNGSSFTKRSKCSGVTISLPC